MDSPVKQEKMETSIDLGCKTGEVRKTLRGGGTGVEQLDIDRRTEDRRTRTDATTTSPK